MHPGLLNLLGAIEDPDYADLDPGKRAIPRQSSLADGPKPDEQFRLCWRRSACLIVSDRHPRRPVQNGRNPLEQMDPDPVVSIGNARKILGTFLRIRSLDLCSVT